MRSISSPKWVLSNLKQNNSILLLLKLKLSWHRGQSFSSNNNRLALRVLNGQCSGGLPVIIHSNPSLLINWEVFHKNLGGYETLNTSVDIWLGNIEETNPTKPTTEVMIWMNHIHQRPLGFFIETIYIWGKPFDLYAYWGTSTKWKVFTFIQKQQTWAFLNSDLFDFFKYLWITKQWVDGRQYILGIEAGNEIIQGQGSFTHKYSLKVN